MIQQGVKENGRLRMRVSNWLLTLLFALSGVSCVDQDEGDVAVRLVMGRALSSEDVLAVKVCRLDRSQFLRMLAKRSLSAFTCLTIKDRDKIEELVSVCRTASEDPPPSTGRGYYYALKFVLKNGNFGICTVSDDDYVMCYTNRFSEVSGYPSPKSFALIEAQAGQ